MKHLLKTLLAVSTFCILFALSTQSSFAASYTVKPGDWLSTIAPNNWQEVCRINRLADCNVLYVGQVLQLTATSSVSTAPKPVTGSWVSVALATPYVYGGVTPYKGFDCSGLTQWVSRQRGYNVPRTSQGQIAGLRHVSLSNALPGDIVAFNYGHVGVYMGDGKVLHALNPSQGIRITTMTDAITYNGFLTVLAVR